MHAMRMRLFGASLVLVLAAIATVAIVQFRGGFTNTEAVSVLAPRAGLVLDPDAKVKLHGVQIGRVTKIDQVDGDGANGMAKLTLALDPDQMHLIPSDVKVDIRSTTVFGAKYVNFEVPSNHSSVALSAGQTLEGHDVTVEYDTLFQHLSDTLGQIEPEKLNATLEAIAQALHGRGAQLADLLTRSDSYLTNTLDKKTLDTLEADLSKVADVSNVYADAAPGLLKTVGNAAVTSDSIVAEKANLNTVLLGVLGLNDTVGGILRQNQPALHTSLAELTGPTTMLHQYAPVLNCLIVGLAKLDPIDQKAFGGMNPGVTLNAGFMYGSLPYKYPMDLPKVHATGGPNCYGLPDPPMGVGAPHAPFMVDDSSMVPWAPSTKLQVNGANLLQILYGGLYPGDGEHK